MILARLAVCLAATLPYLSTVDDYFLRDDFGVVQLLAQKPASSFLPWFTGPWMDDIWGYTPDEIRPFPAVSYQLTALGGAGSPVMHHVLNVAIHAVNGLLVLAIGLEALSLTLSGASFAALAFVLLPAHPESVAWITGRVDSMPALFYLATFLAYVRWRRRGSSFWYWTAIASFFVALFTKQTAITMAGTLVAYDVIVRRDLPFPSRPEPRRSSTAWLLPYLPFVLLTAAYLALRYALFGHVAREDQLNADSAGLFARVAERHLARVVLGDADGSRVVLYAVILSIAAVWMLRRAAPRQGPRAGDVLLFAGPVWWIVGVVPVAVAGYESSRHAYLASAGWGLTLGVVFDLLRSIRTGILWPRLCTASALIVLAIYTFQLSGGVREYNQLAAISEGAVRALGADVPRAPEESLFIVGVPHRSWEWALPFAVRPPFTRTDLTSRVFIISPRALHCCSAQWFDDTRGTLERWTRGSGAASVVAVNWSETSRAGRTSTAEYPDLPQIARALLTIDRPEVLNTTIERLLSALAPQPQAPRDSR